MVTRIIPQFFAIAGIPCWPTTAGASAKGARCSNARSSPRTPIVSISKDLDWTAGTEAPHGVDIELTAFLRLLGRRDAYRRIYQMRAEPIPMLEFLWQHPQAPRSVLRCLTECMALLRESGAGQPRRDQSLRRDGRADGPDPSGGLARAPAGRRASPALWKSTQTRDDSKNGDELSLLLADLLAMRRWTSTSLSRMASLATRPILRRPPSPGCWG